MTKEFRVGFSYEESRNLFNVLDDLKVGKFKYEEFLSAIVSEIPDNRKALIISSSISEAVIAILQI